jgi:hypothetical protein
MKKNIYFSFQIIYFIVVITAAIIILYLSLNNDILRNKTSFFLFLFLASLAEILPINLPKDAEVTVGFAVFMGAILVLGTKASVWLAFIAAVIPEIKTKRFIRIPYNSFVNISIYH